MKVKIYSQDGKVQGEMELADEVFAAEVDEHLLYLVIKSLRANQRQGTSKTRTRAEVSGGGRKPWKQKHTGNARSGSNTSPVWVRGGKAHGPSPREYVTRIPKAQRMTALKCALSSRAKEGKIMVIDRISAEAPKTKVIVGMLNALSVAADKKTLLIIWPSDKNVYLSGRNVQNLHIRPVGEINALDIVKNEHIIFGEQGLVKKVEEAVTR
jgi:large subunit ribosomal protein L4